MPKVSIIVPIYNVEKYLSQCMDSILKQTLRDIEIICVDDGSTDNSGTILDNYSAQDNRVKVLHRANAGYGATMNAGLDVATGEYIGIVESDDCILPNMYETLYECAKKNRLDFVKSDAFYWLESAGYCERIHNNNLEAYYDRVLEEEKRWEYFLFFMNIWTGIYRKAFLEDNGIRFNETPGASYQDNGFWIQTLTFCKRVMWLSQAFYMYRQDNPMASVKSQSKIMAMTNEYEYVAKIMETKNDTRGLDYCNYYRVFRHRGTFFRIADECKREFCEQIKNDYSVYKEYVHRNPYLTQFYDTVCTNPDEVCKNIIDTKQMVREKLNNASSIIVYGAGARGHIVLKGLYNEGLYNKLSCFAVSENPEDRLIANKEIMLIGEAIAEYPDALVIIAVVRGTKAYNQMLGRLNGLGVTNYMDGSDIEENFYIL